MLKFFAEKNVSSYCSSAKATHIFSAKNIRILCIESAKTVNEMTLNKLIKLTMLWTTGPWMFSIWGKPVRGMDTYSGEVTVKSIFASLLKKDNKLWHFMWIICLADESHEMSTFVFETKKEKKLKVSSAAVVTGSLTLKVPVTTIVVCFVFCWLF